MKFVVPAAFVLLFAIFLPLFGLTKGSTRTVFKVLCTGVALTLCTIGAVQHSTVYGWLMVIGMFFGLLGDIAIERSLLWGMALFFTGHIFYCTAFWTQQSPGVLSLILFAVLFGTTTLIGWKYFRQMDFGPFPCIAYAVLLSAMAALAVPLFSVAANGKFAAIGALFFFLSDAILAIIICSNEKLPKKKRTWMGACNMITYYLGQFLLALSVCGLLQQF